MEPPALPDDVIEALHAGRKIDAIKRLRETRSLSLAEAKDAVEQYAKTHAIAQPRPLRVPVFWPIFIIACIIIGAYVIQRLSH